MEWKVEDSFWQFVSDMDVYIKIIWRYINVYFRLCEKILEAVNSMKFRLII